MAKKTAAAEMKTPEIPAKIVAKQVFEVDDSRLGIGVFSRPLLDNEMRRFRAAWERCLLEGLEDSEVDPRRISFVTRPESMPAAWNKIDSLLAAATGKSKKVA